MERYQRTVKTQARSVVWDAGAREQLRARLASLGLELVGVDRADVGLPGSYVTVIVDGDSDEDADWRTLAAFELGDFIVARGDPAGWR